MRAYERQSNNIGLSLNSGVFILDLAIWSLKIFYPSKQPTLVWQNFARMTHRGHSDGWVVKNFRGTNVHKNYGNKIFASPNLLLCVGLSKSTVKIYWFLFISENTVVSIIIVPGSDPRTPNSGSSLSRHKKGDGGFVLTTLRSASNDKKLFFNLNTSWILI